MLNRIVTVFAYSRFAYSRPNGISHTLTKLPFNYVECTGVTPSHNHQVTGWQGTPECL